MVRPQVHHTNFGLIMTAQNKFTNEVFYIDGCCEINSWSNKALKENWGYLIRRDLGSGEVGKLVYSDWRLKWKDFVWLWYDYALASIREELERCFLRVSAYKIPCCYYDRKCAYLFLYGRYS